MGFYVTESEALVINALLGRDSGLSAEAIAKTVGWTRKYTYKVLASLQRKGVLGKRPSPHVRYGKYAYYLKIPYEKAKRLAVYGKI